MNAGGRCHPPNIKFPVANPHQGKRGVPHRGQPLPLQRPLHRQLGHVCEDVVPSRAPLASKTPYHELAPANALQDPAAFMIRRDRDRVAHMDGALPVRVRPIAVGGGRRPRQGRGHSASAPAMPPVRQSLLAHEPAHDPNRPAPARCVRGSARVVAVCGGAEPPYWQPTMRRYSSSSSSDSSGIASNASHIIRNCRCMIRRSSSRVA